MRKLKIAGWLVIVLLATVSAGVPQEADEWKELSTTVITYNSTAPNVQQAALTLLEKYPLGAQMAGDAELENIYANAALSAAYHLGNERREYEEALQVTNAHLSVFWHSNMRWTTVVHALHLRYLLKTTTPEQEALQFAQAATQRVCEGLTVHQCMDADLHMGEYIRGLLALYKRAGQSDTGVSFAQNLPIFRPDLIDEMWYWKLLSETYMGLGQFDKAKQAAVMAFRLCRFDQKPISKSLALLHGPMILGGEKAQAEAFLQYLKTGEGDNPLAQVPGPQLTQQQIDQMLLNTGGLFPALVNAYLYTGQFGKALETAQMEVVGLAVDEEDQPGQASKGILDIARCFKAKDMHLLRANQFIEWVQTGQGENPLGSF